MMRMRDFQSTPGWLAVSKSMAAAIWPSSLNPCSPMSKPCTSTARPGQCCLAKACSECIMRSEEHTSELQSLMRISYAVFCLKKNKTNVQTRLYHTIIMKYTSQEKQYAYI